MIKGITLRTAEYFDIPSIMNVIKQAQGSIKTLGIDQWQNGYPDEAVFKADIDKKQCYVFCFDEALTQDTIQGVLIVSVDPEESYCSISGKGWLSKDTKYAVIHRMAVTSASKGVGLSDEMLKFAEELCKENNLSSLRADTHTGNIPMQKFLIKNGFTYCGDVNIAVETGDPIRMAYEKLI